MEPPPPAQAAGVRRRGAGWGWLGRARTGARRRETGGAPAPKETSERRGACKREGASLRRGGQTLPAARGVASGRRARTGQRRRPKLATARRVCACVGARLRARVAARWELRSVGNCSPALLGRLEAPVLRTHPWRGGNREGGAGPGPRNYSSQRAALEGWPGWGPGPGRR